jgi:flagellar motor switch protein FliG
MAEAAPNLSGAERAAVLLMTLGEQEAAEIMRHMAPRQVQKVSAAMAQLSSVSRQQAASVLAELRHNVESQTSVGVGSDDYIRSVLKRALGDDRAASVIDRVLTGGNAKGLDMLKWLDARAIADAIRLEHPQILAIVLAYLDSDQSAEVLAHLPEQVRPEVLRRIAVMEGIEANALAELNDVFEKKFSGRPGGAQAQTVGGIKTAADILNRLSGANGATVMEAIKQADAELATRIEDKMFVFEDLAAIDDRGVQAMLREIASESLLIALKGSSDGMKEKIFKNMSKRAAEMLRDDLEAKGPVKLADVEKAQKEILAIARKLADAGEIALGGKGGEEYV